MIDTGDGCPATDQRGVARAVGLRCDVGAFEFGAMMPRAWLPLVLR